MLKWLHELFGHPYHYVVGPLNHEPPMCLRCGSWLKPKYRHGYKQAKLHVQALTLEEDDD